MDDPKIVAGLCEELPGGPPGTFLDFGCGQGEVLRAVSAAGWRVAGIELCPEVAASVATATGLPVSHETAALRSAGVLPADVLHLGDVIEHLTDLDRRFERILDLLRPGGTLLAQGPLEAGPTLFSLVIEAAGRRRSGPREHPPYHVLQASVAGQRRFFERQGLQELAYRVTEVDWPAPTRLSHRDLPLSRNLALWSLRRLSRGCSRLAPGRLGNRYFYRGRKAG